MNVLFVCSRNQWRSPTAEAIYKTRPDLVVRSAGTSNSARIKLTSKTIHWADLIFVMEKKHKEKIMIDFAGEMDDKTIIVLDIPDEYKYMDAELIEELTSKADPYL